MKPELYRLYEPTELTALSSMQPQGQLPMSDLEQLIKLAVLDTIKTIGPMFTEVQGLNTNYFPLHKFYELLKWCDVYEQLLNELSNQNKNSVLSNVLSVGISGIREKLNEKNPIYAITSENNGYVLIHASTYTSIENLLHTSNKVAEICTTAGFLQEKTDIFYSETKSIECALIYNPTDATAWFSKDVGSHTENGVRILESRFQEFRTYSLIGAIAECKKNQWERIEVWVDAVQAKPVAILILDKTKTKPICALAKRKGLPVIYNGNFFN